MRIAVLLLLTLLAACQSKPVEQMTYSEQKTFASELEKRCAAQGYPRGHPEFMACAKQEFNREHSQRAEAAQRRRDAANSTTYCQQFGATVTCF